MVTELGIVIEAKPVQPLKALDSIVVTELGIDIEVKLLQFSNAFSAITETVFGMVYSVIIDLGGYLMISVVSLLNNIPLIEQ